MLAVRKKDSNKSIRRRALLMSFIHMITMYILYLVYSLVASDEYFRLSGTVQGFLILSVGTIVYMGYCILHEDKKAAERYSGIKSILITNIICVICWTVAFLLYSFDELFKIKDGVIDVATSDCIWLFIVPVYVVNTAILLIKYRVRKSIRHQEKAKEWENNAKCLARKAEN